MDIPKIKGFTVTPNVHDWRVECNVCHGAVAGDRAPGWARWHGHDGWCSCANPRHGGVAHPMVADCVSPMLEGEWHG